MIITAYQPHASYSTPGPYTFHNQNQRMLDAKQYNCNPCMAFLEGLDTFLCTFSPPPQLYHWEEAGLQQSAHCIHFLCTMLESTSRLCSFKIIKMIIVSLIYFSKMNYFSAGKSGKINQGSTSVKTLLILEDGLPGSN